jgi:hypothetical protein
MSVLTLPFVDLKTVPAKNLFFVGLPGSGTAVSLICFALRYIEVISQPVFIENYDDFHVGKDNQLQTLASLSQLSFRSVHSRSEELPSPACKILGYLPGLRDADDLVVRHQKFNSTESELVLVLDSTRSKIINDDLLDTAVKLLMPYIILTKLDLCNDTDYLFPLLHKRHFKVLLASYGERIPTDFNVKSEAG